MGRITETPNAVVIVTMVTVYVDEETIIRVYWWKWESEVNLALMERRLKKYLELTVRLHTAGEVWYLRLPCFICRMSTNNKLWLIYNSTQKVKHFLNWIIDFLLLSSSEKYSIIRTLRV